MKKPFIILIAFMVIVFACKDSGNKGSDFLANNIDTTVNPAEDFFDYAQGTWLKNTIYRKLNFIINYTTLRTKHLPTKNFR